MARFLAAASFLVLFLTVVSAKPSRDRNTKNWRLVCYLGSWAWYRHGDGAYDITKMDPRLCTHLIYGFAKLENDRITAYDSYLDLEENWGKGYFKAFNSLRQRNPELTTIIAIGGWNEGSQKYSDMAKDPSRRRVFVQSVLDFLQRHGFDGLDFDWEYPASRDGSRPEDKENFIHVIKELKEAFQPYGYLLTAAVSAGKHTIDPGYDIPNVAKYLDFVNLMTYDYHGAWDSVTGHNSPLFARPEDIGSQSFLNVDYSVKYWLTNGLHQDKLVMGMPLYGRCFHLADPSRNGLGDPIIGPGQGGIFTNEPGMMGYNELCSDMKTNQHLWKTTRPSYVQAPYASKGNQWCGFDDPQSLAVKVNYLKSMGLGGAMVWSLETDDFHGRCSGIRYPLLNAIWNRLNDKNVVIPTSPTDGPSPPTIAPETTVTPPVHSDWCVSEGIFGFLGECLRYYQCIRQNNVLKMIPRICPTGTSFDVNQKLCMHSSQVDGCGRQTTVAEHTTRAPAVTTTRTPDTTTRIPETSSRAPATPTRIPETTKHVPDITTTGPSNEIKCSVAGMFPHPTDCTQFYKCQSTNTGLSISYFTCPPTLVYNPASLSCDYIRNVPQCQKPVLRKPDVIACGSEGYHPYPGDCSLFIHCMTPYTTEKDWIVFKCPLGLFYSPTLHVCDWNKPNNC